MRQGWAILGVLVILLLPAAAQAPPEDPGLAPVWQRALRDPLVALPLERPVEAEAALARLDRLAKAFADSQALMGNDGSGPILRQAAPDAAALRGIGADRVHIGQFLAVAPAFRAGRLSPETHAEASVRLLQIGDFLDRMEAPVRRYPAAAAAWEDANEWYSRLAPLRAASARLPGANVTAGTGTPGGTVQVDVNRSPGNGTLVTPWGNATVGSGSGTIGIPVPGTQTPGNYTGSLVVGGRPVANVTIRIDAIPLTLEILGPRQVAPLSSATYRIAMTSRILVDKPGRFNVTADGEPVAVTGGAFLLDFPAEGSVQVRVTGGPGSPWGQGSALFTVQVAPVAKSGGLGPTGLAMLVAIPSVAMLAIAAALRARRRPMALNTYPTRAGAEATGAEAMPGTVSTQGWSIGSRLRAWWSSPAAGVVADYRRAARILGESGRLSPGSTHADVAGALELEGIRPKVARRLATAYEHVVYGGLETETQDYWQARKGEA